MSMDAVKRHVFERVLAEGLTRIWVDTRVPGVMIPDHLRSERMVALDFSNSFRDTAPPLISDSGVSQVLSFSGKNFECIVPWLAAKVIVESPAKGGKRPPLPPPKRKLPSYLKVIK